MGEAEDANVQWGDLGVVGKAALVSAGPVITIGLFSMGSALPRLAEDFAGEPNSAFLIQLIGGIVAPLFAFFSPVAGWLIGRFGVRQVYAVSLLIAAAGGAAPALCDSLFLILACRVALAIGLAGAFTAALAGIAKTPEKPRNVMLGLVAFFGGVIAIALFPLVGVLAKESWRLAFLVHLVLALVALPVLALPGRDKGPAAESPQATKRGLLGGAPASLLMVTGLAGLAMVAASIYSAFYLASVGVADPATIGLALGMMSVCSLVGSGGYGFVQRLLGTRGMLILSLVMSGAGCVAVGLSTGFYEVALILGLISVGLAAYGPAAFATAIEAVGPEGDGASAVGGVSFALYGSQILFPFLAGVIAPLSGPSMVYFLLGGIVLLGAGAVWLRPIATFDAAAGAREAVARPSV